MLRNRLPVVSTSANVGREPSRVTAPRWRRRTTGDGRLCGPSGGSARAAGGPRRAARPMRCRPPQDQAEEHQSRGGNGWDRRTCWCHSDGDVVGATVVPKDRVVDAQIEIAGARDDLGVAASHAALALAGTSLWYEIAQSDAADVRHVDGAWIDDVRRAGCGAIVLRSDTVWVRPAGGSVGVEHLTRRRDGQRVA
jgi:hypothetical protein